MKIDIDMQGIQTESRHRGIGRYTRATTTEFLRLIQGRHDARLLFNAALNGIDEPVADLASVNLHPSRSVFGPLRRTAFDNPANEARREAAERVYSHALDIGGADVVWFTSLIEGYKDDAIMPHELPRQLTVATLYDIIPLHTVDDLGQSRARDWYMRRIDMLRRCDLLLAISSWVRDDAIERLGLDGSRIVTIGAGVDARFRPAPRNEHDPGFNRRMGIDRPFVLYTGGTDKRKNVEVLFPAFAALPAPLRERHQLVVVGSLDVPTRRRLERAARAAGLDAAQVVFPGHVPDEDLIRLYQTCALFVFPSAQEGFGLPPLEAMACGAPVIVNNATSLPEVVNDPSAMFDASAPSSITAAIRSVLEDPARTDALREAGIRRAGECTWSRVAARAIGAIEAASARFTGEREATAPNYAPVNNPSDGAGVQIPLYLMDRTNAAALIPTLRAWPGLVEWQGLFPATPVSELDRYRVGGWQAVVSPEVVDWSLVLAHESVDVRQVDVRQDPHARRQWIQDNASHPLVRQRIAEDDIAARVAPRLDTADLARIADALDRLRPRARARWLVDVTHIASNDLGTGIQRVVRSVLVRWLRTPPVGVRIEPIVFRGGQYHHAHTYAAELLKVHVPVGLVEDTVAITGKETFVGLDWAMESLPASAELLWTWQRAGVGMHFIIHDLLPITLPEAFHPQTRESFNRWLQLVTDLADAMHCISRSTADELTTWVRTEHGNRMPTISTFPLGVEVPSTSQPVQLDPAVDSALSTRPSFLMVGTIEPRKGHEQALDAFELLWESNADVTLLIVGKQGWLVGELIQRLERHVERGQRLFWFEACPDVMLDTLYRASTALLVPSLGEGFGLPVVEAAQRGKPVIARSLKVFREIAGDYPSYFDGTSPAALATYLARWLAERPMHAPRNNWPTWDEAASVLAGRIQEVLPR
ncbi:glycosyltransferase involved in cell wall biosynthesis [Luteibacter jiangsuensis]|uniref:Glycosyltransferase involved in cell wall biosynthesis n=1 Tax=Luteibacter jiangsuensis TaxID=637577 RepID=A0ABT9T393_9GAMM|nr:glycosyltransferase family 1 protein [Luteibacter jiangsuensis]MDQ0010597.1 glycosyltransferase involved in cell wall biosynthesis [Luteibacter jiangsuensis]